MVSKVLDMPKSVPDRQLNLADAVSRCRVGDREALGQVYEICHSQIYGLMVRMVGKQEAADLTQQVFLQLFSKINRFAGQSKFETWLYRLAVNEALQYLRREKRRQHQRLEFDSTVEDHRNHSDTELKELLEQALVRIDPQLRSIFLLREVEELSYREISEAVEIPEGTVGSRLNRARRELQRHLIELGWEA